MDESRNPKPAEDVAGDTESENSSRNEGSSIEQIADSNSSETTSTNDAGLDENSSAAASPAPDEIDVERDKGGNDAGAADVM